MRADAAVVICAYTELRWAALMAAVESVAAQERTSSETVVVVDHNDALCARAARELVGVTVVPNAGPAGLSGARNTGVAMTDADIVAFLDDDAVARPGWLSNLLDPYADPAVSGVGGRAEPLWPEPAGRPGWWPPEFDWVVGCSYEGLPSTTAAVRNLIGCNMSFRRDVFLSIGAFTPGIGRSAVRPLGCEETELCIRVSQGLRHSVLVYEPAAVVGHRVDPGRVGWRYFRRRCHAEGRSKAVVSRRVGSGPALSTERRYLARALTSGLRRDIGALVRHRDLDGGRRALCAVSGVAAAAAGFAAGALDRRVSR